MLSDMPTTTPREIEDVNDSVNAQMLLNALGEALAMGMGMNPLPCASTTPGSQVYSVEQEMQALAAMLEVLIKLKSQFYGALDWQMDFQDCQRLVESSDALLMAQGIVDSAGTQAGEVSQSIVEIQGSQSSLATQENDAFQDSATGVTDACVIDQETPNGFTPEEVSQDKQANDLNSDMMDKNTGIPTQNDVQQDTSTPANPQTNSYTQNTQVVCVYHNNATPRGTHSYNNNSAETCESAQNCPMPLGNQFSTSPLFTDTDTDGLKKFEALEVVLRTYGLLQEDTDSDPEEKEPSFGKLRSWPSNSSLSSGYLSDEVGSQLSFEDEAKSSAPDEAKSSAPDLLDISQYVQPLSECPGHTGDTPGSVEVADYPPEYASEWNSTPPDLWSKAQVQAFLKWVWQLWEFPTPLPLTHFELTGAELLALTSDELQSKTDCGHLLYAVIELFRKDEDVVFHEDDFQIFSRLAVQDPLLQAFLSIILTDSDGDDESASKTDSSSSQLSSDSDLDESKPEEEAKCNCGQTTDPRTSPASLSTASLSHPPTGNHPLCLPFPSTLYGSRIWPPNKQHLMASGQNTSGSRPPLFPLRTGLPPVPPLVPACLPSPNSPGELPKSPAFSPYSPTSQQELRAANEDMSSTYSTTNTLDAKPQISLTQQLPDLHFSFNPFKPNSESMTSTVSRNDVAKTESSESPVVSPRKREHSPVRNHFRHSEYDDQMLPPKKRSYTNAYKNALLDLDVTRLKEEASMLEAPSSTPSGPSCDGQPTRDDIPQAPMQNGSTEMVRDNAPRSPLTTGSFGMTSRIGPLREPAPPNSPRITNHVEFSYRPPMHRMHSRMPSQKMPPPNVTIQAPSHGGVPGHGYPRSPIPSVHSQLPQLGPCVSRACRIPRRGSVPPARLVDYHVSGNRIVNNTLERLRDPKRLPTAHVKLGHEQALRNGYLHPRSPKEHKKEPQDDKMPHLNGLRPEVLSPGSSGSLEDSRLSPLSTPTSPLKQEFSPQPMSRARRVSSSSTDSGTEEPRQGTPSSSPSKSTPGMVKKPSRRKQTRSLHLWEFLKELLENEETCPRYITWISREEGVFRLVNSGAVAKLWGQRKNRRNMNYEKMSRALRYYYERHILERVPGQRLIYKFAADTMKDCNFSFMKKET